MSRVINPDSAGKQRSALMRTGAEILRRLSQKGAIDDDVHDMVAHLVFVFHEIDEGIDVSATAWEKRDYWMKADDLRQRWAWSGRMADELQALVFAERWDDLPAMIVKLFPYFNDVKVTKMMRKETLWRGSYTRLLREKPPAS
jgi:hypothetical protein